MKNLVEKDGKLGKLESSKLRDIVTGHSMKKEREDDPKLFSKRNKNVQDCDRIFTIRSKVPLVNSGIKQKVGMALKYYLRVEVLTMEENNAELDADEAQLENEYLEQNEEIRLKRMEMMDNKMMAQRYANQAPDVKYLQKAVSDSSMPADVRKVKHGKYTTILYHD